VASRSRPGLGTETLQQLTALQRQVSERSAPLRIRERQRSRQHARRLLLRAVAVLVPLVLALGIALDTGGGRSWLGDRWGDLSRSTTVQEDSPG
jgi:hypothetical protein